MSDDDDSFNDSEYDDYNDNEDVEMNAIRNALTHSAREVPFESFNEAHFDDFFNSIVQNLSSNLNCTEDEAEVLLRRYEYDENKILRTYSMNKSEALQFAGIPPTNWQQPELMEKMIECKMCLDDVSHDECVGLWCGHQFCRDCWEEYIESKANRGGATSFELNCPEGNCNASIPKSFLLDFNLDPSIYEKLDKFAKLYFIQCNGDSWKWCPGLNCNCVVQLQNISILPSTCVTCENKHSFCYKCGMEDHSPISCELLEQWLAKCEAESGNAQWIITNTRKCPKCKTRIQKNHGCNHIICTKCKYEFCWVCMGNWKDHGIRTGGFYKCNRYKEKRQHLKGPKTAKEELDRYLHFYRRYLNHDASRRYIQKHRQKLVEKMERLQTENKNLSWIDVQFIQEAGEQIEKCRQLLKFTYVLGYYMRDFQQQERDLFEFLQQDLERNTEFLHEMTEQPVEAMDREEVINYTRVTKGFGEKMLAGIKSGLTSNQSNKTGSTRI